jgi:hypothetical protein
MPHELSIEQSQLLLHCKEYEMIRLTDEATMLISDMDNNVRWLTQAGIGLRSSIMIKSWDDAIVKADDTKYVNLRIEQANMLIHREIAYYTSKRKQSHLRCFWHDVNNLVTPSALSLLLSIPEWPPIATKIRKLIALSIIGNFGCAVRSLMIGDGETSFFRQLLDCYMDGYFVCGAKVMSPGKFQIIAY